MSYSRRDVQPSSAPVIVESPVGAFDTPVAISVYSRPHFVRRLVAALRPVRPRHLLVFADGPNPNRPGDEERCQQARDAVGDIDWPCEIEWNMSAVNLGARRRIQSGLSWVFGRVEEAIVFEEDCIPDPTFLPFCRELLARYRNDTSVLLISGMTGRAPTVHSGPESYEFSINPNLYGWAAWRRTWAFYEPNVESWPDLRPTNWLRRLVGSREAPLWEKRFDLVQQGLDTWDFSLVFSCWKARGLSIRPRHDLVENIGFGPDGTHTLDAHAGVAKRHAAPMTFPLVHPVCVDRWRTAVAKARRIRMSSWTWRELLGRCLVAIRWGVADRFGPAGRSGRLRWMLRSGRDIRIDALPPVGASLDMSDVTDTEPALTSGWSFAEKQGRWTIGMQATAAWRLDREVANDMLCRITATPALNPSHPGMRVDVFINDMLCAASTYGQPGTTAGAVAPDHIDGFRVPRTLVTGRRTLIMTIFVRWPFVPADHAVSDDFRT